MKSASPAKKTTLNWQVVVIALLSISLIGVIALALIDRNQAYQFWGAHSYGYNSTMSPETMLDQHGITPLTQNEASNNSETAKDLTFIVEEEKLAHDVYVALYDKWGMRVFDNIQNSETVHQDLVLAVMKSRSLADPRQIEAGKFTNQDLQKLYDELVAQGSKSLADAYKVGIAIEEKDIADIKDILARLDAKDTDIKDVLENLSYGSENHLRAFTRQSQR